MRLKNFTTNNPLMNTALLWGSGWEVGKNPGDDGWRAREIKGTTDVLVGRRGHKGCFRGHAEGDKIEVTLYAEDPITVVKALKDNAELEVIDTYEVEAISGWGIAPMMRVSDGKHPLTMEQAIKKLRPYLGRTKELAVELETMTKRHLVGHDVENLADVIKTLIKSMPRRDRLTLLKNAPTVARLVEGGM